MTSPLGLDAAVLGRIASGLYSPADLGRVLTTLNETDVGDEDQEGLVTALATGIRAGNRSPPPPGSEEITVIEVLAQLRVPRAREVLLDVAGGQGWRYRPEPEIRRRAAVAAAGLGEREAAVAALVKLLGDPTDTGSSVHARRSPRSETASSLAQLGEAEQAAAVLWTLAETPTEELDSDWVYGEVALALQAIGKLEDARAVWVRVGRDRTAIGWMRVKSATMLMELQRPQHAFEVLRAVLLDSETDPWYRSEALEELARHGQLQALADELGSLSADVEIDASLRLDVARAQGDMAALKGLAEDPILEPKVRVSAARSLGEYGDPDAAAAALRSVAEERVLDPAIRLAAAAALGDLGLQQQAVELLLSFARDRSVRDDLRIEAARRVGELGEASASARVLAVLAEEARGLARLSDDWDARGRAMTLLESVGELEAAGEVARALVEEHKGTDVHCEAISRLASLIGRDRGQEILVLLASDTDAPSQARWAAINALRNLGKRQELVPLLAALARADREGHQTAIRALAELDCGEEILSLLREGDRWIAEDALPHLVALGQHEGLRELVRDRSVDPDVRLAVCRSLLSAGGPLELVDVALEIALRRSSGPRPQLSALHVIEEWRGADAAGGAAARMALDERTPVWARVQAAAIAARGGCSEEALGVLRGMALDAHRVPQTRRAAADALAELGDEEDAAEARQALDHVFLARARNRRHPPSVRFAAIQQLNLQADSEGAAILRELARCPDLSVWEAADAAEALTRLGCDDDAALIYTSIVRRGEAADWYVEQAAKFLEDLARVHVLRELALDTRLAWWPSRKAAASAYGRVAPADAVVALVRDTTVDSSARLTFAMALLQRGLQAPILEAIAELAADPAAEPGENLHTAELLLRAGEKQAALVVLRRLGCRTNLDALLAQQLAWRLRDVGGRAALDAAARDPATAIQVRAAAAVELGKVSSAEAAPILLELASDPDAAIEDRAYVIAHALPQLGQTRAAVELFTGLVADPSLGSEARREALDALATLASTEELQNLALNQILDPESRVQAAEALLRRGEDATAAVALRPLLSADVAWVRLRAATQLASAEGPTQEVLAAVDSVLKDASADDWTRESAALSLGALNAAADTGA